MFTPGNGNVIGVGVPLGVDDAAAIAVVGVDDAVAIAVVVSAPLAASVCCPVGVTLVGGTAVTVAVA